MRRDQRPPRAACLCKLLPHEVVGALTDGALGLGVLGHCLQPRSCALWRERVAIANGALGPGGLAARRGLVPVIGIGAASCAEAARLSEGRFAVATTIGGLSGAIRKLADDAGCGAALTSVLAPAGDPAALMADARATEETLAALISRARARVASPQIGKTGSRPTRSICSTR